VRIPKYPSYEKIPSNWFDRVPVGWGVLPLRRIARLITEKADASTNPIALENIQSWTGRLVETESEFHGNGITFKTGDLLFGKLRPYLAKAYLAKSPGEAVGDFHVLRPSKSVIGRYFNYQVLTPEFISAVTSSSYGSKMPRASWEDMANLKMATPSHSEQETIATFLDRETTKIDALVAEQEKWLYPDFPTSPVTFGVQDGPGFPRVET
jgi:type I restriction enzyme S subunit